MILLSFQIEGQMVQQEGLRGSSRQPQVYAGMMGRYQMSAVYMG